MRIPAIGAIGILLPFLLAGCSGTAAETLEASSSTPAIREEAGSHVNEAAIRQVVRMILTFPGARAEEADSFPEPEATSLDASSAEPSGTEKPEAERYAPFFTENGLEAFRVNHTPARLRKRARESGIHIKVKNILVLSEGQRPGYCTYTAEIECSGQDKKSRSFTVLGDALFQEEDGVDKIDSFWMDYSFYWELDKQNEN